MDNNLKEMTKVITKTEQLLRPDNKTDISAFKKSLTVQDLAFMKTAAPDDQAHV